MSRASLAGWLCLGYAAFIVYGSLVPLDYHPQPLAQAWAGFRHIPFLQLGVASRADWVANGVLYLPIAFLGTRAALGCGVGAPLAVLLAVFGGAALAVGVEFTQLFFPPRTVSLNDLMAETLGCVVGALAACWLGGWVDRVAAAWAGGGTALLTRRLLEVYAVGYLLLSFFPYDLLLSAQELADKAGSTMWSGWLAPSERGPVFVALQLGLEVALTLPFGLLLARRRRPGAARGWLRPALAGALLGGLIEGGQFFVASGVSQGASVASRSLGVVAGALLAPWLHAQGVAGARAVLRRAALPLYALWLPALLYVSGWFSHPWHGAEGARQAWQAVQLLPFYYHYYTTEAIALFSLGAVAVMYLPLALLGWARQLPAWRVAAVTALAATLVEAGKLFVAGLHPDPSNVLIAVAVNTLVAGPLAAGLQPRQSGADALPAGGPASQPAGLPPWLLLPLAALGWLTFPVARWPLLGVLVGAAVLVWRWPVLALALVPAALPVLDLAPWSGRIYVDEFDLLSLVCFAIALQRCPAPPRVAPRLLTVAFALVGASLALSTLRAFWPPSWPDANSLIGYAGPTNALRIAKGAVWAWLFVRVWRALAEHPAAHGARRGAALGAGVCAGLALTIAVVVWERVVFTGLLDFAADYRVTALFSAMHKGGAFIECWLAVASAFTLAALQHARRPVWRLAALLLLVLAAYAMMVTYSRNGYAALAAVLIATLALTLLARRPAQHAQRTQPVRAGLGWATAAVAAVALVVAMVLGPVASGGFAWQRLAQSADDLAVRQAHWADGLRLRDDGLMTALVGMGLGRFPDSHFWRSQEPVRAASFRLVDDAGKRWLRLGQGATVYVEQIVARPAGASPTLSLTLSMQLRAPAYPVGIAVMLCEKWTLSSLRCVSAQAVQAAAGGGPATVSIDATPLLDGTAGARPLRAPWKLALLTPERGWVEVTHVRLSGPDGAALLVNGDFAQGLDRWFFAVDADPPWQLHSLPLTLLFEQGWFGVLAFAVVLVGALVAGVRLARAGRAQVPAAVPALLAFCVCGSLNTLIDAPRFLGLLLLLMWLAADELGKGQGRPASATLVAPPSSPAAA